MLAKAKQPKAIWYRASRESKPMLATWKRDLDRVKPASRIAPRSKRETKRMKEYNARRVEWLREKRCAVYPILPAVCIHHIRGRVGRLLMAEQFWLAVSLEGHIWIDANREQARARGWLAKLGDWGRQP